MSTNSAKEKHRRRNALAVRMSEKAKEFKAAGSEIYQGSLSEGVEGH
jgi:hypothetical protein